MVALYDRIHAFDYGYNAQLESELADYATMPEAEAQRLARSAITATNDLLLAGAEIPTNIYNYRVSYCITRSEAERYRIHNESTLKKWLALYAGVDIEAIPASAVNAARRQCKREVKKRENREDA